MNIADYEMAILDMFVEDVLEVEDILLLYSLNISNNIYIPYKNYARFDLNNLAPDECVARFRFEKHDIHRLANALQLPQKIVCENRTASPMIEGLCVLLQRVAYPNRYYDLVPCFGRSVSELCYIFNKMVDLISLLHGHLLQSFEQEWLQPNRLKSYADAVHEKGAALDNCWGFVDGTVRPICRPNKNQKLVYNGHKKVHALKFQSVIAANGLIANLFGPLEGKRHDSMMLTMSGLLTQLEQHSIAPDGSVLCIYGDPAYPLRPHLQSPYRNNNLTEAQKAFNVSMSQVRVSVEWVFGDVIGHWKFLDFKKDLKIGLSAVGKQYTVAVLLRNALTCLYGSIATSYLKHQLLNNTFKYNIS